MRRLTAGEGVHVVLNALADDFIPASISVLARGGRFLEMGKRGIWSHEQVAQLRADVRYFPFDLGEAATANPSLVPELFAALVEDFEKGRLRPLPIAVWALDEADAAFRAMAQARHVGKIVLVPSVPVAGFAAAKADACYLVTGGLGALGLAVARRLVQRGARHLVLTGRSAPQPAAQAVIAELQQAGASIRLAQADISDATAVEQLFAQLQADLPPLRGIVHAAGVLDDGVVLEQTWPRAAKVLAPKVQGGWLLAKHARAGTLDFFVCYSSATGVLASGGQTPYAMANAFLDGLCQKLRASGVPATSIQWGPWQDGGMAASLGSQDAARFAARGIQPMSTDAALDALELVLEQGVPEAAILAADWSRYSAIAEGSVGARSTNCLPPQRRLRARAQRRLMVSCSVIARRRRVSTVDCWLSTSACLRLRSLGLDANTAVEDTRPLKELGLDSLMAVELRNALSQSLGCSLPATLAFDYPTVATLATHLVGKLSDTGSGTPAAGRGTRSDGERARNGRGRECRGDPQPFGRRGRSAVARRAGPVGREDRFVSSDQNGRAESDQARAARDSRAAGSACAGGSRAARPDRDRRHEPAFARAACAMPESFGRLLWSGTDAVTEIPAERWSLDALYADGPGRARQDDDALRRVPHRDRSLRCGVLRHLRRAEAETMDPQQRLMLEVAWEALEDAGRAGASLAGSRHGRLPRHLEQRLRARALRASEAHRCLLQHRQRVQRAGRSPVVFPGRARPERRGGHGVLIVARRVCISRASGAACARMRHGARRRRESDSHAGDEHQLLQGAHDGAGRALQDVRCCARMVMCAGRVWARRSASACRCACRRRSGARCRARLRDQPGWAQQRAHRAERPCAGSGDPRGAGGCAGRAVAGRVTSKRMARARRSAIRSRWGRWGRRCARGVRRIGR